MLDGWSIKMLLKPHVAAVNHFWLWYFNIYILYSWCLTHVYPAAMCYVTARTGQAKKLPPSYWFLVLSGKIEKMTESKRARNWLSSEFWEQLSCMQKQHTDQIFGPTCSNFSPKRLEHSCHSNIQTSTVQADFSLEPVHYSRYPSITHALPWHCNYSKHDSTLHNHFLLNG